MQKGNRNEIKIAKALRRKPRYATECIYLCFFEGPPDLKVSEHRKYVLVKCKRRNVNFQDRDVTVGQFAIAGHEGGGSQRTDAASGEIGFGSDQAHVVCSMSIRLLPSF